MKTRHLRKLFQAFCIGALAFVFQGCATPPPPKTVVVTGDQINQTVALNKGDTLQVVLEGSPTTGFVWQQLPGKPGVVMSAGSYDFKPSTATLGSPGLYTFTYKTIGSGDMRLEFVYVQPGHQSSVVPQQAFAVNVRVSR